MIKLNFRLILIKEFSFEHSGPAQNYYIKRWHRLLLSGRLHIHNSKILEGFEE
jgi:hypothetical protein